MIDTQTIVIATLVVTEAGLIYQIATLKHQMKAATKHFATAKDFLGLIQKALERYEPLVERIQQSGLDLTINSEKFGKLEIHLKGNKEAT